MSPTIDIPKNERGVIRVFAINDPDDRIADLLKTLPKPDLARQLLQDPHLNTASTEIFPVSDLTGMGLAAYLTEGYAVEDESIAADRARLDALDGYVLLLFSDSFGGTEMRLTPSAELTLIGTYAEFAPPNTAAAIETESAQPYSGAAPATSSADARGAAGSATVVLVIIVILGVGLWWLLT